MPDRPLRSALLARSLRLVLPAAILASGCARPPIPHDLSLAPAAPPPPSVALAVRTAPPAPTLSPDLERALGFDLPPPRELSGRQRRRLWATYYYLPEVAADPDGYPLWDLAGRELGPRLAHRDWCEAAMQGTVRVVLDDLSAMTVTFARAPRGAVQVDCTPFFPRHPAIGRSRFYETDVPFGEGARRFRLVPYRTIAVDPRIIPYGSILYVPAARGTEVVLPDGSRRKHDGYFFAGDTGGAIRGRHVDVFLGLTDDCPFDFVRSRSSATFTAWVVREPEAELVLASAHDPVREDEVETARAPGGGSWQARVQSRR